jgi:PAP2 superfamily protein
MGTTADHKIEAQAELRSGARGPILAASKVGLMRTFRGPFALVLFLVFLHGTVPCRAASMDDSDDGSVDAVPGDLAAAPLVVGDDDRAGSTPDYLERYSRPFRVDTGELAFTQKYYWHRLTHPTPDDKRMGGVVLAVSFALWSHKDQIQSDWAQRGTTVDHETTLKRIEKLGGGAIVPATALCLYLGGSFLGEYRSKQTGVMIAQSLLLTDLVTLAGRWVLAEDRPKYGGSLHPFQGFGGGISGHSATAASISGVLSRMYLQADSDDGPAAVMWKRIGKGFAYGLPVLVAFGRVNDQQHYLYNTVLGLSIGYWSGNVVADAHGFYIHGTTSRFRPSAIGPVTDDRGAPGIGARWNY